MVATRPSGTCHVEQVEPAGFTREYGRIGPSASGRTRPQARGLGAGDQAPPHLRRRPPPRPGRRVKSQRVGNPSVSRDAAASALKVPHCVGPGRKGPGSTGLGGRTQDRSQPRGTRNGAVGSSQNSAGISGRAYGVSHEQWCGRLLEDI
ncbi:hypothetical protein NDU88_006328 [Pleurodeles waltl]|uniref:Uncharacterized protein n=1 Tax=Pleurodeles waltl TaxID=8319 RepID=A0AAV7SPH7_PLEWA|nr:hypothetical protein NDU88_006328 [Pleurodeles waltl]